MNTNDRYKKLNPETPVSFFFKNIEYKAQETTASNINRSPERPEKVIFHEEGIRYIILLWTSIVILIGFLH